jgi:hypothetical protein
MGAQNLEKVSIVFSRLKQTFEDWDNFGFEGFFPSRHEFRGGGAVMPESAG